MRKVRAEELLIHISGEYDEERILLNDNDSPIAPIIKQFVDNDIQLLIMEYIGEEPVPVFWDEEEDDYDDDYEDDFVIDEKERTEERYQRYQTEKYMYDNERYEYYEY